MCDIEWSREGMTVEYVERVETDAIHAEVFFQRIKRHYFEVYEYEVSMTPDAVEHARRATTWLAIYLFRRGLFEVIWECAMRARCWG